MIIFIVIAGLALLILGHEAGHFFVAKMFKMRVDEFGFGFPPRMFSIKKGETEYSFNWLPFGGFVKIAGENDHLDKQAGANEAKDLEGQGFFFAKPIWQRVLVVIAGVVVNFAIAWIMLTAVFMVGTDPTLLVSDIGDGSPAEVSGMKLGDAITGFSTTDEFIAYVQANKGEEISVKVLRAGEELELRMVPRVEYRPDEGAVGIGFSGITPRGFIPALIDGFRALVALTHATLFAFGELIVGIFSQGRISSDVVGLVGIFPVAEQVGSAGLIYVFQLVAMISANLAVINLLPFPALDGGRLVLLAIEKIKGSPLPRKVERYINTGGFVFLVLLMIVITVRDIMRL